MSKRKTFVTFDMDDGSPTEPIARREYVARVSGFYYDIFKKKLESLIARQQQELTNLNNSHETDLFHKANINAFSLLLDWGDEMLSEHMGYTQEKPENIPEEET